MNRQPTYSINLFSAIILIFSAQSILLAPHTQATLLGNLPQTFTISLALTSYLLGIIISASILFHYEDNRYRFILMISGCVLILLSTIYWLAGMHVEGIQLLLAGLASIAAHRIQLKSYDWFALEIIGANTLIGLAFLFFPSFLAAPFEVNSQKVTTVAYGLGFLLSTLMGILSMVWPEFYQHGKMRMLALPWLMWGALYLFPLNLPNLIVSASLLMTLAVYNILPWEHLVLKEGQELGRRFFYLMVTGQGISFALIIWIIYTFETKSPDIVPQINTLKEIALFSYNLVAMLAILVIASINLSINGIFHGLRGEPQIAKIDADNDAGFWNTIKRAMMQPFTISRDFLSPQIQRQQEFERLLSLQVASEKRRTSQLNLLRQLNLELETAYEPAVSAQLTANAIYNWMGGAVVAIFRYQQDNEDLETLSVSGPDSWTVPPGYRQSIHKGIIGRAARSRRTQLISDTRLDPDYVTLKDQLYQSEIAVPLVLYNQLKGVIVVAHLSDNAFDDSDIRTLETVALRLVTSWQRSNHDLHLTELIQAGITLSTTLDVEEVIKEVAEISQKTLEARFVFVALSNKGGGFTRVASAGFAPTLLPILNSDPDGNTLIQNIVNNSTIMRLRDVRKKYPSIPTGSSELRSMIGIPIRIRQTVVGAILAFGKIGSPTFTDDDESLSSLLSTQAGAAVEASWLYQEVRMMFNNATLLYQLSARVIQAEQLTDAAVAIAETCYQVSRAQAAGIVLLPIGPNAEDVKVQIDASGLQPGTQHPHDLIQQALDHSQTIYLTGDRNRGQVCLPLQTPRRQYGVMWVDIDQYYWEDARFADNIQTLANQAAIALERSILLTETRHQAEQIQAAYKELEITYDQTLIALSSALDARDRETEGHSRRVARITKILGKHIGMNSEQSKILERGSILHDIGKIGISDTILLKPGKLSPEEWQLMRQHPDIGARIIEGIPFLQEALPVIRYHQERWDGSGYPIGLKGHEIPLMARIFAVVDAFDALTSNRPYRQSITHEEAVDYLKSKSGVLFDPEIIDLFERLFFNGKMKDVLE